MLDEITDSVLFLSNVLLKKEFMHFHGLNILMETQNISSYLESRNIFLISRPEAI